MSKTIDHNYDVLVVGRPFFDMIFTGLPKMPVLGEETFASGLEIAAGGSFITAESMRRLGLRVGLAAQLGDDLFSRFIRAEIVKSGLREDLLDERKGPDRAITVSLSFPGDRAFASYVDTPDGEGARREIPEPWTRAARSTRCLHFGSIRDAMDFEALIDGARESGALVSMDTQCIPEPISSERTRRLLARMDLVIINRTELVDLTETGDLDKSISMVAALVPEVVVKLGPDGSVAQRDGGRHEAPAMAVDAVDTTGAGDCFNGGYLFGRIQERPVDWALRAGNTCGGLSVTRPGGAAAAPNLAILLKELGET